MSFKVSWLLAAPILILIAGCSNTDTAIFATSTSLGINVERTPPSASIAYDRTEAFVAPRFQNGGAPAAVAAMRSDGTVFNPKIQQLIATGSAAELVTNNSPSSAPPLSGLEGNRRLMFFGTGTTIGLKAAFGSDGAPETLVFGYKRKELSVIPLAIREEDGKEKASYPSTLASIDTVTPAQTLPTTGLKLAQFIAIGTPAENLARSNESVRGTFQVSAKEAAVGNLTQSQAQEAEAQGVAAQVLNSRRINDIAAHVSPNGAFSNAELLKLADMAKVDAGTRASFEKTSDVATLKARLASAQAVTKVLYDALPENARSK